MARRLLAVVGACLVALSVAGCAPKVSTAPEVTMTLTTGERVVLSELRGRVVWLEFWSLTCAPCIEELPAMRALYNQFGTRDVTVIAVAMPWDLPAPVVEFAQREKIPYSVALDVDAKVSSAFDVPAVPQRILIGRDGKIARRESGRLDASVWRDHVMALLKTG